MKKWLKRFTSERDGSISIYVITMLSVLLPFLLFFLFEIQYLYCTKDKIGNYVDIAAAGAVMQVNQEASANGKLVLDEEEATRIATDLIRHNLALDEDLEPVAHSILKTKPIVKVYVKNLTETGESYDFVTDEGFTYHVDRPMVVVYVEAHPQGIMFNRVTTIRANNAYETYFQASVEDKSVAKPKPPTDGVVFSVKNVQNPLHTTTSFPLNWAFDPLPLATEGNVEVALRSTEPDVKLVSAKYTLHVKSETYNTDVERMMNIVSDAELVDTFSLPSEIPIGAQVTVDFGNKGIELLASGVNVVKGNKDIGFASQGAVIGVVDARVNQLIKIQMKTYSNYQPTE